MAYVHGHVVPTDLIVAAVGLCLATCFTIPTVKTFFSPLFQRRFTTNAGFPYEDDDGKAKDQQSAVILPTSHRCIYAAAIAIGLIADLLTLVFMVQTETKSSVSLPSLLLELGIRIISLVQMVDVISEIRPVSTFRKALNAAATCITQATVIWINHSGQTFDSGATEFASLLSSFLAAIVCIMIQRRPDVYFHGKPVDRQLNVSLVERLTFSWISPLFSIATAQHGLQLAELPVLDHSTRAGNLARLYSCERHAQTLLKFLLHVHARAFLFQYLLTILQSICIILPQTALYLLLKALEDYGSTKTYSTAIRTLVLGLGMLAQTFLGTWAQWVSLSRLKIPIQIQLSALIFQKALRRRDVKSVADSREAFGKTPNEDECQILGGEQDSNIGEGAINIIGVDAKRVSDFAAYNNILIGSGCKLLVSFGFLVLLIGWPGVLAGLVAQAATMPINVYVSKKYASAQGDLMAARDRKLRVITETLSSLLQIKFSTMEALWERRINESRFQELLVLKRIFTLDTILICTWLMGSILLSAISLGVYVMMGQTLTSSVAFTTISVFAGVESSLTVFPEMIAAMLDAWISLTRIQDYLDSSDKPQTTIPGDCIQFRDSEISWPTGDSRCSGLFTLKAEKLDFPTGEFSIITGPTGSGKSLLLAAIIGEGEVLSGIATVPQLQLPSCQKSPVNGSEWIVPARMAYVAQEPWIENATIRDNILFGLPFVDSRYREVIWACALVKDIEMLCDGDLTEIGHNGVNLSGGQKWRLTLARALYSRAGILILDDVFSAVDANVGRHILVHALGGPLGYGRTRILATHHMDMCVSEAKYHVRLGRGIVQNADEITSKDKSSSSISGARIESPSNTSGKINPEGSDGNKPHGLPNQDSHGGRQSILDTQLKPRGFVEEEIKQLGGVKLATYWQYIGAAKGWHFWTIIIFLFGLNEVIIIGRSWWIARWTSEARSASDASALLNPQYQLTLAIYTNKDEPVASDNLGYYLGTYLFLSLLLCFVGTLRYRLLYFASLRASQELFRAMVYSILRAPKIWVDTVPIGRILNRFSTDFMTVDSQLCNDLAYALHSLLIVVGIAVSGAVISPLVIPLTLTLLVLCAWYSLRYLAAARDMRRLEAISRSQIFESCSSAVLGVSTIRAFKRENAYVEQVFEKIDTNGQAIWYTWCFNEWFSIRLGVIGAVFSVATVWLIVSFGVDPALAGFALSFTLQYTDSVVYMLKRYTDFELGMNAMERISEYANMAIEDEGGAVVPASWPSTGHIEIESLVVSYAPDLFPVLKGVTCSINGGERIGIVGRTGAGKSSLAQAIFRFVEAQEGSICIDGIDISTIRLQDLRSRLAIIPQDPVLSKGTVRSNLDPFDEHSDMELQRALEYVCLGPSEREENCRALINFVTPLQPNTPDISHENQTLTLTSPISASGANVSQGQRQLLSLARAILTRPKLLILDEATSAVDKATDALIQRSIRTHFAHSTILVIAHRLSTIIDFDKIMVIRDGKCVEFGPPGELLRIPDGELRHAVESSAGAMAGGDD